MVSPIGLTPLGIRQGEGLENLEVVLRVGKLTRKTIAVRNQLAEGLIYALGVIRWKT